MFARSSSPGPTTPRFRTPERGAAPYRFTSNERWTLLLLMAGFLVAALLAWLPMDGPAPCPVHRGIGLHCPGCGLTRAAVALVDLRPADALALNPLIVFVVGYAGYRLAAIVFGLGAGRHLVTDWPRWWLVGVQVTLAAVWLGLLVIRTGSWLYPELNPAGWGLPSP